MRIARFSSKIFSNGLSGTSPPAMAASRTGATTGDVIVLSPEDLLAAWEAPR